MNRREALKFFVAGGVAASLVPAWGALAGALAAETEYSGTLAMYNVHTDESLVATYLDRNGRPDPAGLDQLNHFFRCHYTKQIRPIEPKLFLFLDAVSCRLGARGQPFHLISGFRSPEYNDLLRQKSGKVAKQSYHLKGMAADVRLEGVSLAALQKAASRLRGGGVGMYSEFVHLDVGPVRSW